MVSDKIDQLLLNGRISLGSDPVKESCWNHEPRQNSKENESSGFPFYMVPLDPRKKPQEIPSGQIGF